MRTMYVMRYVLARLFTTLELGRFGCFSFPEFLRSLLTQMPETRICMPLSLADGRVLRLSQL